MAIRFIPDQTNIPFMSFRWYVIGLSIVTSLLCLFLVYSKGFNFGVDFAGGTLVEVQAVSGRADIAKLRVDIAQASSNVEVQEFGDPSIALIRLGASPEGTQPIAIADNIKNVLGDAYTIRRLETVGPRVSEELIESSIWAVAIATFLILIYLWFRFEWQFAVGAVIATMHDIVLVLGFYAFTGLEFNLTSVAAILTILGYSLNDTVVVYDRIRETLRRYKRLNLFDVINNSINSTLSRTIYTSITTMLALIALVVLGGDVIYSFSMAMLFGVIVGTYSSICVASPMLIFFNLRPESVQLPEASQSS